MRVLLLKGQGDGVRRGKLMLRGGAAAAMQAGDDGSNACKGTRRAVHSDAVTMKSVPLPLLLLLLLLLHCISPAAADDSDSSSETLEAGQAAASVEESKLQENSAGAAVVRQPLKRPLVRFALHCDTSMLYFCKTHPCPRARRMEQRKMAKKIGSRTGGSKEVRCAALRPNISCHAFALDVIVLGAKVIPFFDQF